jgi:hypothetical protein
LKVRDTATVESLGRLEDAAWLRSTHRVCPADAAKLVRHGMIPHRRALDWLHRRKIVEIDANPTDHAD